ncbi:hypothetical protein F2Q69_00013655 [Brassica cretica]|uniref:Uncharacterized protein n=1 Tax=Brassica cretica TaxID=69181 RepID=A0A8S9QTQ0_BRACR|nr:hypothetical protein F2Q69_00013655 [Brassica cretica]
MNSEKDSYDKPSRMVTRILEQIDHEHRNNETSIRLDQPGSPRWRVRPNKQSNLPTRRVGLQLAKLDELDRTRSPNRPLDELASDRTSSPTRQAVELDRTSSPTRPLVELDRTSWTKRAV